jgi:hypothetical protein
MNQEEPSGPWATLQIMKNYKIHGRTLDGCNDEISCISLHGIKNTF